MYKHTPSQELTNRLQKMQQRMNRAKLDGCLISGNVNLFYFSGTIQQSYLYIPAAGPAVLLVRKDVGRAGEESALDKIMPLKRPDDIPRLLREAGCPLPQTLGLELEIMTAKEYLRLEKIFANSQLQDCTTMIRELRMVKSPYELERMRESALLAAHVYQDIPGFLKPGMKDVELAAAVEHGFRTRGHIGLARFHGSKQEFFFGQVLAGENALVPSGYDLALGGKGLTPAFPKGLAGINIERNQPVLIDYCGNSNGYCVDITRTFSIGPLPGKLQDAYRVALEIQEEIILQGKPGVSCAGLYEKALELARRHHLQEYFMGYYRQAPFIGHGIGLEVNELPVLAARFDLVLEPGMTLAVEPKFTLPGLGAAGIENTFVVTAGGLERITRAAEENVVV